MVEVGILRLDHVQLAMPAGRESEAVAFYEGVLGIACVPKPDHLAVRGGCWFEDGDLKVHLGVDVVHDEPLDGFDRVDVFDPFGNRIELMQPGHESGVRQRSVRPRSR
jgi:catechol 2,3-dioxygenase-like lactoylglutathione lyase family enzyme